MQPYSKRIKWLLGEYSRKAHERELHRELAKLDASFDQWRRGEIGSGDLDELIHKYKSGPARELWKQYNQGQVDMNVAYAIVAGILDETEIPEELLEALDRPLAFYRNLKERGELRLPE
jgi:regulator of protease activity HflC (stomatin/prohibitin superfamily)